MTHKLNMCLNMKPIKLKDTIYGREKQESMRDAIEKLTKARFFMEVIYSQWLANPCVR